MHPDDCWNGPSLVVTKFTPRGSMYLARGWKSFTLTRSLKEGHVLYFKFDGTTTLFLKIFRRNGDRMDYCVESGSSCCSSSTIDDSNNNSYGCYERDISPGPRVKEEDSY
ncbi:hypothetical protein D1007_17713 [Hordeum vulgare]|nr:hypothetical protein D1007_17713 [Hordeum vulgare]